MVLRGLFNSKVARRIFLLFLATAVIPTVTLAVLGLGQINLQLSEQTDRELHLQSKFVGTALLDRLNAMERELDQIAVQLRSVQDDPGRRSANIDPNAHSSSFRSLQREWVDVTASEGMHERSTLSASQQKHLLQGHSLLTTASLTDGQQHILLTHLVVAQERRLDILRAEVATDVLFDLSVIEPNHVCVFDAARLPLYCTDVLSQLTKRLDTSVGDGRPGAFDLTQDNEHFRVSYWTLFLKFNYDAEPWLILLAAPSKAELSQVNAFKVTFSLVLGLMILLVILGSTAQIRRQLVPLELLKDAAESFSFDTDKSTEVSIRSHDEFEDLGKAFNRMTVRLRRQFRTLSVMSEIDRSILASSAASDVIETLLYRTRDLLGCDALYLTRLEDAEGAQGSCYALSQDMVLTRETMHISEEDIQSLNTPGEYSVANLPVFFQRFVKKDFRLFQIYPLSESNKIVAHLTLAYVVVPQSDPDAHKQIQELTDRASVALSNIAWQEKLYRQAHFDILTNLPNRLLLRDRLDQALARASQQDTRVALLFIDVDRFKQINDSLGHRYGDDLVVRLAQVISASVGPTDTVARFGGDEFIVVLTDVVNTDSVSTTARHILDAIQAPHALAGHEIRVTASVGIAIWPEDGASGDELKRNADTAMYQAKQAGPNNIRFYAPNLHAKALHTFTLESKLRRALERDELELFYQPQIALDGNVLVGAEALLRWRQPELGLVSPAEFIPLAEDTGLIVPFGEWVLYAACQEAAFWQRQTGRNLHVAVNVSALQFREGRILEQVKQALRASGLAPSQLELEVTESVAMEHADNPVAILQALKDLGVSLSLDDFGTGYSSLSYLHRLPLHALKIDQSFVRRLPDNPDAIATVKAIVALAQGLNLALVGEGVETQEQLAFLQALRCHCVQGYLFSKPLTASDFAEKFLDIRTSQVASTG